MLAKAKVNLTLHITGRRADGYHRLDSLVVFADLGDRLVVEPGDTLAVTGPFADGVPTDDSNLIRRALSLAGTPRAVTLEKNLPHPAGIGGGSSDAAAALRAVDTNLSTGQLLSLGADVPVCLRSRATRMRGVGEILAAVDLTPLHAVLVNPGVAVPTGSVFRGLHSSDNAGHPTQLPDLADMAKAVAWLREQRNDLQAAACEIAPIIETVLTELRAEGALLARMSGSGATCFGLWSDRSAADAAAVALAANRPDWWVRPCTLT